MSQTIILGWDALDIELIEEFGLSGRFGANECKIETHANPVINEPHTRELWPSMITGLSPDQHGVHAVSPDEGVQWDNPLLNVASKVANGVIPQDALDFIGKQLRERGAGLDQKNRGYYAERGIETVFDGTARPISVPNFETDFDRRHGLDATRDNVWAELLVDRDGAEGFDSDISQAGMYDVLGREMGKRLGHTLSAVQQGHSLVWTWFGCLDTVGHMAPAVNCDLQRDWYEAAANVTETVRQAAPDDSTVVSVSDHGLQDGEHTDYATICSDAPQPVRDIDHVFDVADWVWRQDDGHEDGRGGIEADAMGDIKDQLEGLGYV